MFSSVVASTALRGHDERRPVPLLSHYLHVIPVSMILKCSGATKITNFSNTSEIALEQFQNCSRAAQSHRLSEENCAGFLKVHDDEMREAAADATPPAFSVARRVFRHAFASGFCLGGCTAML